MFNLPTGTILINVWIKVRRLRLYLLYLHYPSLLAPLSFTLNGIRGLIVYFMSNIHEQLNEGERP